MSDHIEHKCSKCGSLLHHADECNSPQPKPQEGALLPCPFCDEAVKEVFFTEDYYAYVICRNCGATGTNIFIPHTEGSSKEAAIKAWNTRAPQPTLGLPPEVALTNEQKREADEFFASHFSNSTPQMKPAEEFNIGDKIKAKFAYPRKCSERFNKAGDWNSNEPWLLKPIKENFEGFIVGRRNVIMSEFKPHYGGGTGEDYEQGYVTGKHEKVWLVVLSLKHEPFIVRDCDIESIQQNSFAAGRASAEEEHVKLVERSVGAMTIAEGDEGWEKIPIDCPMLEAVRDLRVKFNEQKEDKLRLDDTAKYIGDIDLYVKPVKGMLVSSPMICVGENLRECLDKIRTAMNANPKP